MPSGAVDEPRDVRTTLVCMPWLLVDSPCIQLGQLQASLAQSDLPAVTCSFHLALVEFAKRRCGDDALTPGEYEEVSTRWANFGLPEWLFAVPPFMPAPRVEDARFVATLCSAGIAPPLLIKLQALRAAMPEFLAECATEVLASAPDLVGFTLVYSQTVPSVALARALKRLAPKVRVVFGGALCDGPSGPALLRAYAEVDYVVRGEGERVLPRLVHAIRAADDAAFAATPGLCYRRGGDVVECASSQEQRSPMDALPLPDYAEYFARLARGPLAGAIAPRLPYQSARGCWWGMRSHCTFCGINGDDMEFRSKSPARAHRDLLDLARLHGVLDFTVVDNIMDMGYLKTLAPALAAEPHELGLFCETKSNLKRAHVRLLARAGVRTLQPGIESLSTSILEQMGKGVTGLQNVRLLKWCAEFGVHVIWNLLYGFPREDAGEYARMAEILPSLVHLAPPNLGPLMCVRFSPYHDHPDRYGLVVGAPLPFYAQMYGAPSDTLRDLAAVFEHAYDDGRDPEVYVAPLRQEVERWQRDAARNRGALNYRRGPGFVVINDARTTMAAPARYHLEAVESAVYLACDAGATVPAAAAAARTTTGRDVREADVHDVLRAFLAERLVHEENGRYLSLATPTASAWGKDEAQATTSRAAFASRAATS